MNEARRERIRQLIRTLASAQEKVEEILEEEGGAFEDRSAPSQETESGNVSKEAIRCLARILFSTKAAQYAFGETDQDGGRRNIESFAAQHHLVINFMPVEGRVYFVRDPTAVISIA